MTAFRPQSWDQALQLRHEHPDALVVAGATALQPLLNAGVLRPPSVLLLASTAREPVTSGPDGIRLDALTTVQEALDHPRLRGLFPDRELRWFAVPAVRRRATLVGNLLAPGGRRDLAVLLMLADARLEVRSEGAVREVTVSGELTSSTIGKDELVTAVTLSPPAHVRHARAGRRSTVAAAAATVAIGLGSNGPRVVVSVGGRIARVPAAETVVWNSRLMADRSMADDAGAAVTAAVREAATEWSQGRLDDDRQYAVHAAGVLARRCLRALPAGVGR